MAAEARRRGWRVVAFAFNEPSELAAHADLVVPARYEALGPVLAGLQVRSLPFVASGAGYRALFLDTGGLRVGDAVRVAGVDAGRVIGMEIEGAAVAVAFRLDAPVRLGNRTRVDITTATVLGAKNLRVTPGGENPLRPGSTIGTESTTSPYQLTEALGDLTDRAERIGRVTDELQARFGPHALRRASMLESRH